MMKTGLILMLFGLNMMFSAGIFAQSPLNWELDELEPGFSLSLNPDEIKFSEGIRSCGLTLKSSSVPYLISEVFYITPGSEYEFSIDVLDQDTAGMLRIYADFYDTYGFDVFGQPPVNSEDSADWQNISWSGIVPSQAVVGYILVKFFCQPDPGSFIRESQVWIDNARFSESGGENLVVNGGFESWTTGVADFITYPLDLTIFPNPADEYTYIYTRMMASTLAITDISGRIILSIDDPGVERTLVSLSGFAEGIYIVKAISPSGAYGTGKLIVKR
jgi:hypothetical protein